MLADMSRTKTPSRGVLITGASRGIGAAAVRAFAKKGDRVVVYFHQQQQRALEVLERVEIWQRTLAANLLGPANLTWQIARHMIEIKPADGIPTGRIVNVGSRGAYRGEPEVPAYGASKAGLHAFGQ